MTVRINLEKKYQQGSVKYHSVQPPFLLGVGGVLGMWEPPTKFSKEGV